MELLSMIVIIAAMAGIMWWQSRKAKQQQQQKQDFRANLRPGTEIITIGGVIGKVVSVDTQYEEIVIDTEGSLMRFGFNAISREYIRPAFVSDDEVDENGNPLPTDDAGNPTEATDEAQKPVDAIEAAPAGRKAPAGDAAPAETEPAK